MPLAWAALQRYPGNAVLAGTLTTTALGAIGAAQARGFDELLASVVVIGLGFGCTGLFPQLIARARLCSRSCSPAQRGQWRLQHRLGRRTTASGRRRARRTTA